MTALTDKRYVLFTADCHIKQRTWNNSALLKGDASEAFRQMLIRSDDYDLDTLLIGGDLFDSNRPSSADLLDVKLYLKYKIKNILYIRGNHDSVKPSFIRALEEEDDDFNVHVDEVSPLWLEYPEESHDVRLLRDGEYPAYIAGIPYIASTEELKAYIKDAVDNWRRLPNKGTLYLMLHTAFEHLLGFDGAYQLTIADIYEICGEDKVNVLVGHIHTRDTKVYNEAGCWIHSPGSLYPLSTQEMDTRHFASVLDLDAERIEDVCCDVRDYADINIADVADASNLEQWLDDNLGQPLEDDFLPTFVRLHFDDTYRGAVPTINNEKYITQAVMHVSGRAQQSFTSTDYTLQQAVAEELAAESNGEMLVDMANALLLADDPVAMLDDWTSQWGVRKAN